MSIKDPSSHPDIQRIKEMFWTHRKTGKEYTIIEFGLREQDLTIEVRYQLRIGKGPIWSRPATEFFDGRFLQCVIME